jgi:hypothetical protein
MFLTDLVETRELDFFATAELLECDIEEEKKKINND